LRIGALDEEECRDETGENNFAGGRRQSGAGASQLYLKKAYLQARIDHAPVVRFGAADLPWVPYAEAIYGYRYLENTLIDRVKAGTSSDWGVHVLGSFFGGLLNYDFAAVNGGGYKKFPGGGNLNRFAQFDRRPRQRRLSRIQYRGRRLYRQARHALWRDHASYDRVDPNTKSAPARRDAYYTFRHHLASGPDRGFQPGLQT
jgi:hypothetical protein